MTVEKFLNFWSHHNATIIEVLIFLTLLSIVYLAYISFFKPEVSGSSEHGDLSEIEKSLKKVLENQNIVARSGGAAGAAAGDSKNNQSGGADAASAGVERSSDSLDVLPEKNLGALQSDGTPDPGGSAKAGGAGVNASGMTDTVSAITSSVVSAELKKLQNELNEKDKKIVELQAQANQAAISGAPGGAKAGEVTELKGKVKDLESRLAEYEIISEDIADLSFFKEENRKLQDEIKRLQSGEGGGASSGSGDTTVNADSLQTPETAAADAPVESKPEVAQAAAATQVAEVAQAAAAQVADVAQTTEAVQTTEAAQTAEEQIENAAVEQNVQQALNIIENMLGGSEEKSGEPVADAAAVTTEESKEDKQLLNQFENFVKKENS